MAHKVVVMGVSGCGKSSLGAALAQALDARLIEGDDFHLPASQHKMQQGIALTDEDRWPWLERIGAMVRDETARGVVLTCSALKRAYRDRLRALEPALRFVFIEIDEAEARARVGARAGHFFPSQLVANQFAALESPVGEAGVVTVQARLALTEQRDVALHALATTPRTAV